MKIDRSKVAMTRQLTRRRTRASGSKGAVQSWVGPGYEDISIGVREGVAYETEPQVSTVSWVSIKQY